MASRATRVPFSAAKRIADAQSLREHLRNGWVGGGAVSHLADTPSQAGKEGAAGGALILIRGRCSPHDAIDRPRHPSPMHGAAAGARLPASASAATLYTYALLAAVTVYMSASFPCTSWKLPIGCPNCLRCAVYGTATSRQACNRRRNGRAPSAWEEDVRLAAAAKRDSGARPRTKSVGDAV